jgi:hypothetical protein
VFVCLCVCAARADTPLGAIGVTLNGVVLFNPSAAGGAAGNGLGSPPTGYNYNAGSPESYFGEDASGAHPNQGVRIL